MLFLPGVLLWVPGAFAEDLNAEQVKALLSGKTAYAWHEKKEFDITTYFAEDGTLVSVRKGGDKWKGKWRIDGNGMHCMQLFDPYSEQPRKEHCRIVEKDGNTYKRIKVKPNGRRIHIATYKKFADGNAENL
jgi:hypothetical protein